MNFSRRQALQLALAGGAAGATTLAVSQGLMPKAAKAQGTDPFASQVAEGVNVFKQLAEEQLPLVEDLLDAIKSGDLQAAQAAYVEARPPYEQIEVLAASFEDTDSDIDARPAGFDDGELDAGFKGFHKIEIFLYREGNLPAAVPFAEGLIDSVKTLISDLNTPSNFSSALSFDGMIGLSGEVAFKKICSEEEAWSDQSLLIFLNNYRGIFSQYLPFAAAVGGREDAAVKRAHQAALNVLSPYFTPGQTAAVPYSSLTNQQKGQIVTATIRYRGALIAAAEKLGII
ncbi:MAG: EfeM/EfeO family lipoprotein [Cyanobacteria bacterium P01_F01_bin.116]